MAEATTADARSAMASPRATFGLASCSPRAWNALARWPHWWIAYSATSCGFATPMGYQTNLMIYGPGGYKFSDYVRFGGPLNLLVMAITVALAPLIWPF
ncbi:MAG: hypothetical protein ACKOHG_03085 [Planctomycetia bacterium]